MIVPVACHEPAPMLRRLFTRRCLLVCREASFMTVIVYVYGHVYNTPLYGLAAMSNGSQILPTPWNRGFLASIKAKESQIRWATWRPAAVSGPRDKSPSSRVTMPLAKSRGFSTTCHAFVPPFVFHLKLPTPTAELTERLNTMSTTLGFEHT